MEYLQLSIYFRTLLVKNNGKTKLFFYKLKDKPLREHTKHIFRYRGNDTIYSEKFLGVVHILQTI